MRLVAPALCALLSASCARAGTSAEPDPLTFLQVGVDPAAEAESVADDLRRAGFEDVTRDDHGSFVVVLARRGADGASRLRVVTARGTAFAVDAPDPRDPERLDVRLPEHRVLDVDDDAGTSIVVAIDRPGRTCLGVVRVTAEGVALEVPLPLDDVGPDACVERVEDVSGDARRELVAVARLEVEGFDAPATRARPITSHGGTFRVVDPSVAERYHAREEARLAESLARADAGPTRIRIAFELAWLALLRGADEGDAIAAFDRDVGVPDEPTIVRAREALRERARARGE